MKELAHLAPWQIALVLVPVALVCLIAAWTDWHERKVFNKHTYPLVIVGLVTHTIALGWAGLGDGLLSVALALVIGLVLSTFGWMGGGDIKLLMGVGASLGMSTLLQVTFYSVWVGAILGLLLAASNGYIWIMFRNVGRYLRGVFRMIAYKTKAVKEELEVDDERNKVPFAIAIMGGVVLTFTDAFSHWPGFWQWYLEGIGMGG